MTELGVALVVESLHLLEAVLDLEAVDASQLVVFPRQEHLGGPCRVLGSLALGCWSIFELAEEGDILIVRRLVREGVAHRIVAVFVAIFVLKDRVRLQLRWPIWTITFVKTEEDDYNIKTGKVLTQSSFKIIPYSITLHLPVYIGQ